MITNLYNQYNIDRCYHNDDIISSRMMPKQRQQQHEQQQRQQYFVNSTNHKMKLAPTGTPTRKVISSIFSQTKNKNSIFFTIKITTTIIIVIIIIEYR